MTRSSKLTFSRSHRARLNHCNGQHASSGPKCLKVSALVASIRNDQLGPQQLASRCPIAITNHWTRAPASSARNWSSALQDPISAGSHIWEMQIAASFEMNCSGSQCNPLWARQSSTIGSTDGIDAGPVIPGTDGIATSPTSNGCRAGKRITHSVPAAPLEAAPISVPRDASAAADAEEEVEDCSGALHDASSDRSEPPQDAVSNDNRRHHTAGFIVLPMLPRVHEPRSPDGNPFPRIARGGMTVAR